MGEHNFIITRIDACYEAVSPNWERPEPSLRPYQGLLIFTSGRILYNIDGEEVPVGPGDILKLSATRPYSGLRLPGEAPGYIVVDFSTAEPGEYDAFPLPYVTRGTDFGYWYGEFSSLLRAWRNVCPERELLCRGMLYQLLAGLISSAHPKDKTEDRLLRYYKEHCSDPGFREEKAAGELFLSSSQLRRRMLAATGLSPNAYLESLRLLAAKEKLLGSEDSMEEIALAVGYKNQFYFSRRFKNATGLSPLSYRKLHRT